MGELTQVITTGLVDEVLAATRRVQRRVRKLPSRVVVYFVLALALLNREGYRGVWASLVANLDGDRDPSEAALRHARRRLGSTPLKLLFDQVRGPTAGPGCVGSWWRGLRTVAWDGTGLQVADTGVNAAFFGRQSGRHGSGGYPALQFCALVECGTRALIDAVFDPFAVTEKQQAHVLCRALGPGMLLLADRGFDSYPLMRRATAAGTHLLWRVQSSRMLPVVRELPDGSYLSVITATPTDRARLKTWLRRRHPTDDAPPITAITVRVIEATVVAAGRDGAKTGTLRLVTTLTDHRTYPAGDLAVLYHERWEIETTYYGLKVTLADGRVLRSGTVDTVAQELYGLLVVYQTARRIAVDAAADAGVDPDRISLTVTLRTARLTVITAKGITAEPDTPSTPTIRAAILHHRELAPKRRRGRILPRRVKRPISPFAYSPHRHDKPIQNMTITTTITPPQPP